MSAGRSACDSRARHLASRVGHSLLSPVLLLLLMLLWLCGFASSPLLCQAARGDAAAEVVSSTDSSDAFSDGRLRCDGHGVEEGTTATVLPPPNAVISDADTAAIQGGADAA